MRVIYLGRRIVALYGLEYLLDKKIEVVAVDGDDELISEALSYGIPVMPHSKVYKDIDLVISFLYWKKIGKELRELPKIGCINIHSAPLPEFRGFAPYTFGILEDLKYWGVTALFVDENYDTGAIIKQKRFDVDLSKETAYSLQQKAHLHALELFKGVINEALGKGTLTGEKQGEGRYFSKSLFENLRKVNYNDKTEDIDRKVRAFWCPPFEGAYVGINGSQYTLVNKQIISEVVNA